MKDITPCLLKTIQDDFKRRFEASEKIKLLYIKVKNKSASYREAHEFAAEVGECLASAFGTLSADILPDGRMYYNIAEQILNATMRNNYNIISEVTEQVQKALNERAQIGIKANAEFQYNAGLNPRIVRTSTGKCCEWCNRLVGIYDYEKVRNKGNNVFRRHNNCRCVVEYDPHDGKLQNVHTKQWRDMDAAEARKQRIEKAKALEEQQKVAAKMRQQSLR